MTDEQWLREALGGSIPEPPPAPDRADASRRRARNARLRGAAVVAAAAAVVLAAVLVPALASGDRSSAPEPAPTAPTATAPTPSPSPEALCPVPPSPGTPVRELDAESSAEEVVAAYLGLLNQHDRAGARALVDGFGPAPRVPASYSWIDFHVERVRRLRFISSTWDATAVIGRYRVIPEDGSCVEYRDATFMLGRNQAQAFRIVSLAFTKALPTVG